MAFSIGRTGIRLVTSRLRLRPRHGASPCSPVPPCEANGRPSGVPVPKGRRPLSRRIHSAAQGAGLPPATGFRPGGGQINLPAEQEAPLRGFGVRRPGAALIPPLLPDAGSPPKQALPRPLEVPSHLVSHERTADPEAMALQGDIRQTVEEVIASLPPLSNYGRPALPGRDDLPGGDLALPGFRLIMAL